MMNEWIISSSVLIAAVLLGRFLLRGRISLRLQYALWAVVLVRLLLPVQIFTSDFGTGSMAQTVDIAEPVRQVYVSANEDRYEREYDAAYRQVVAQYEAAQQQADPIVIEKTAQTMAQSRMELDFSKILLHIWLGGMAVMTAVIVSCNAHLALQLKRRRWALDVPESLLSVYVTEAVPTPCVFGFLRPAVYLTPEAARDPQVRSHVLEHELTHYRHFDHVWSVLRSLCLVLHWYNPLVWIAAKVSRADAELACDEGALARLGEDQRGDYGRTLIGLTCSAPISELLITATTMTGSAGSIRERIKLLMKRPRNTVLTVTAVILMVTLIVGCTFAGAPETTETTPSGVDNDMSDQDEEPPSWTAPSTDAQLQAYFEELLTIQPERGEADWYPRALTSFYETPAQIDLFQLFYAGIPGDDNSITAAEQAFLETCPGYEPEFDLVRISATEMDQVLQQYFGISLEQTEGIGLEHFMYWEDGDCYYHSHTDTNLGHVELNKVEMFENGKVLITYTNESGQTCAVTLVKGGNGLQVLSNVEIPKPVPDQTAEVAALFAEGGDPWYLAALAAPYADWQSFDAAAFFSAGQTAVALTEEEKTLITEVYGKAAVSKTVFRMTEEQMDRVLGQYAGTMVWNVDMSAFVYCPETGAYLLVREEVSQLRIPEILSCQQLAENQVRMIYRFPGEDQHYCATLFKGLNWKHERCWQVDSNHLLIDRPLNARPLTEEEITQVRDAFQPSFYDAEQNMGIGNPLAAFLLDMYGDISEMSRSEFLSYYPATEDADEEEFRLLKQKYPEEFENEETIRDMNWPIHRIPAGELEALMAQYTLADWNDLPYGGWYHYLEETNCYYTYYSDVGLFGFPCTGGWVYDGGAMLYNDFNTPMSVLVLRERDGKYYIQAHLPALIAE